MGSAGAILVGNRRLVPASVSDAALLALLAPYCGGLPRQDLFCSAYPFLGRFRGVRPREGTRGRAFQLSWESGCALLEMSTCQLTS